MATSDQLHPAAPSSGSPFSSLKSGLDDLIMSTVLNAPIGSTTAGAKAPLSLQTSSTNFRRFVQKSGPVFIAQDAAESVLRWEDGPKTMFFGAVWAFLCLYPFLFLLLPNVILVTILLSTRPTTADSPSKPDKYSERERSNSLAGLPPVEGSVDYIANLQNIQIMMGRLADLTDVGRVIAPYLCWRDERISLVILQVTVLSGILLGFAAPYVPWRYVLLITGESALLLGHPVTMSLMREAMPFLITGAGKAALLGARLLDDDALSDEELDSEIILIEKFESERKIDGSWVEETTIGGELTSGFHWLTPDWMIDSQAGWAGVQADPFGWVYLDIDGTRSSVPGYAKSRRRRQQRRALRRKPSQD